jgi:hypothetical protein
MYTSINFKTKKALKEAVAAANAGTGPHLQENPREEASEARILNAQGDLYHKCGARFNGFAGDKTRAHRQYVQSGLPRPPLVVSNLH